MRPLTITLDFFGPFRHQTIDFTKFNDYPVFLISGKTGAGKTTIFDAMCFALFGGTSGGDRQVKQMRSDFATAEEVTTVTFTFEHAGQTYRIVRSPEQEVAKKRGSGNRIQPAAVTLTVFNADDQEVEELTKVNAVQSYVYDLLQLTKAQFSQIVLLPQGQFRQFLMANSDEKEKVLRDIFGTRLYGEWAKKLKEQLKQRQDAEKDVSRRLQTLQSQLTWTALTADDAAELTPQAAIDAQLDEQKTLDTQRVTVKKEMEAAKQALTKARAAQTAGQALQDAFDKRQQVARQLKALAERATEMATNRQTITALTWAQEQSPTYRQLEASQDQVQTETSNVHALKQQQATLTTERATAQAAVTQQREQAPAAERRQAQITTLTGQRPVYEQLTKVRQAHHDAQQRVEQQRATVAALDTQLAKLIKERETLEPLGAQLPAALQAQRELDQRQRALQDLIQQAAVVTSQSSDLDKLDQRVAKQAALVTTARTENERATAKYQQLDSEWASEQIAILSKRLLPDQPCPVCGATQHPHPAPTDTITVTEATVKAAQSASTQTARALAAAENQLTAERGRQSDAQNELNTAQAALHTAAASQYPDEAPQTDVQTTLAQVQQRLKQAVRANQQARQTAQGAQDRLTTLQTEISAATDQQTAATTELTTRQSQALQLATQLTDLQQQRSADYADLAALDAHIAELTRQQADYQAATQSAERRLATANDQLAANQGQLTTATAHLAATTASVERLTNQLTTVMTAAWETVDWARLDRLVKGVDQLTALRQTVKAYDQQHDSLNGQLLSFDQTIGDQTAPDLDQLNDGVTAAGTAEQTVERQYYALDGQLKNNQTLVERMQTTLADSQQQQAALAELAQLTNVANGSGPQKLSLERFVLQTYLQRVLKTGNQRLAQLTRGRYQFQLDHSQGTFRNGTGLEINIYDDNAGKYRSVHTLSGGESFVAALSLALALATVIQEQAGGIKIDALFIDEGFGSLDEDALDMAMETLQQVEGQSRMIGIISHVSELEQQLPAQLKVIPQGNGESTVKYQLGFA